MAHAVLTLRDGPVFRFAPSPNGRLHLGHAFSALLNAEFARRTGGLFLLRIEDIDPLRSRPDLIAAVESDLTWLGLRFETPVLRQSRRLDLYRRAIDALARRGLAYPCFCSRGTIAADVTARESASARPWPRDPDGTPLYPRICRVLTPSEVAARIAAGEAHTWRLDLDGALAEASAPFRFATFGPDGEVGLRVAQPARWGDVVIGRRDVPASYHLAVVVDDEAQGVTHVVRGTDLLAATDIHVLLQDLFGYRTPRYHHHDLVRDATGDKLAKSRGSRSLADLRAAGCSADDIRVKLGFT